jgi:hypothetical protein
MRPRTVSEPVTRLGEARLFADRLGVICQRPRLLLIAYEQQDALMEVKIHSAIINITGGVPRAGRISVRPQAAHPC